MAHKGPINGYFQSPIADVFKFFSEIEKPDLEIPLPQTNNFRVLIIPNKERAINWTKILKESGSRLIVY